METLWQDIRYAARSLRQHPLFTIVAVVTLGLGVGANTAIFSVVDAVMLRSLAYERPEQLVQVVGAGTGPSQTTQFSFPNFRDLRSNARGFTHVAAFRYWLFNLSGSDHPESLLGLYVGDSVFGALRVRPAVGRLFAPGAESSSAPQEVVISHQLWQRRFGGDPALVGRPVVIDSKARVVVGILPQSFTFPDLVPSGVPLPSREPDLYLPVGLQSAGDMNERGNSNYWIIGRMGTGTLGGADAEFSRVAGVLAHDFPNDNRDLVLKPVPLQEQITGEVRRPLAILLGAVGLVLLIACANVGGLLLARASQREREIAIRTALGASPGRLARQLLTESVLLSVLGCVLGVVLAAWGVELLRVGAPNNVPRIAEVAINGRVLLVALAGSVFTGLLFGLAPVLQQRRGGSVSGLRDGVRSSSHAGMRRMRSTLVIAEVALAVVLLTGAGLLLRSFAALSRVETGFDSRNLMTMFTLLPSRYASDTATLRFERKVVADLNLLPGVLGAAAINTLPMTNLGNTTTAESVDNPAASPADRPEVSYRTVGGPYFKTLGMRIVSGRDFDELIDTTGGAQVVIINQTAAKLFFPGVEATGRQLRVWNGDPSPRKVIGVVNDVHTEALDRASKPEVSYPFAQGPEPMISLAIRTRGDPQALLPQIRRTLAATDPDQAFYAERTMEELLGASLASRRFNLALLAGFALLALTLAAVGLYGVIAFSVSTRTRELGIRAALGAGRRGIAALVVGEGARLGAAGLVLGLLGSLVATRSLQGLLFEVPATDPVTLAAVVAFLGCVVLIACYIPARRAARTDPVEALRSE